ncbi:MAG: hypothetical protein H6706_22125 [Myxococcales bacterium]|nr:hypothetical protein [Myxococcales bacterium]
MSGAQYEFSGDQNRIIGNLAGKMSVVGLFLILIGLGVAIMAVVGFLPLLGEMPSIPDAVAPEVRDAFLQYTTYAKGNREQLYFGTLAGALQALILLISGVYVRRSAAAFRRIVDSAGRDITHLIDALISLRGLFGILYTLLLLGFLLALGGIGFKLWTQLG